VVVFIVLAVIFFMVMIWGIFLNRRKFKAKKINGTYIYRNSENIIRKNGIRKKHWGFGIQKLKGVGTSFQIRYKIPEFYKKLKNKDRQAITSALIIFGGAGFVCCTLLAVGMGLLESGETKAWYVIGAVILFILVVIVSHIKAVKNAEHSDE
jgi:hypothetical protein